MLLIAANPYYLSNKLFIQILLICSGAGLAFFRCLHCGKLRLRGIFRSFYMIRTGRSVIHTSGLMF